MSDLHLTGYVYSVYTRAARMGLHLAGCTYGYTEVDPFEAAGARATGHPMGRVPTLYVDGATIYETAAILRWCEAHRGKGAPPVVQARVAQVGGIVDSYGYWPLVRQVFSHGWFRPVMGEEADPDQLRAGLEASGVVLDMLDSIAKGGDVLDGVTLTSADCHLAPMVDAFQMVPEGAAALAERPALDRWFNALAAQPAFLDTRPDWPDPRKEKP
ncbi:glutathione S-transferase family protein [uncultured Tateyamaria sp.]|uniref:glutathione S-transferase family protein n=1 Tax=uncultured Tateyamaria sp. TaxID=455651 RepID=UPI0026343555|nr:glutathione S-transferase family protein [uncultured Tateyamaria sp.]